MATTHQGSCHCGRVCFEVDGEIDSAMSCNCSMCQRKGSLLWFVPRDQLRFHGRDHRAALDIKVIAFLYDYTGQKPRAKEEAH